MLKLVVPKRIERIYIFACRSVHIFVTVYIHRLIFALPQVTSHSDTTKGHNRPGLPVCLRAIHARAPMRGNNFPQLYLTKIFSCMRVNMLRKQQNRAILLDAVLAKTALNKLPAVVADSDLV